MNTIGPDSDKFNLIQLWLHIHLAVGFFIKRCVTSKKYADDQAISQALQEYLDFAFANKNLWFNSTELFNVWKYECANKDSFYACEDYLKRQEIRRAFP